MAQKKEKEVEDKKKVKRGFGSKLVSVATLSNIRGETRRGIYAVLFFTLAIIFFLAGINKAGSAGSDIFRALTYLFGVGYFLFPILFLTLSASFAQSEARSLEGHRVLGGVMFFISGITLIELIAPLNGGLLGASIAHPLVKLFDLYASLAIGGALFFVSILIIFELDLVSMTSSESLFSSVYSSIKNKFANWRESRKKELAKTESAPEVEVAVARAEAKIEEENASQHTEEAPQNETQKQKPAEKISADETASISPINITTESFVLPSSALLENDKGRPAVGDIKANANIIKRTLQNFGIAVEMDEITIGPTVTRYALKPAEGVKLSRIIALQDDLALALAAHPLRIEAPIPGKSLVGIEIPNTTKSIVGMGSMFNTDEFMKSPKPLLVALGRSIAGTPHYANLAKMPHLLIAGTTGSGKSIMIHSIVMSLLFRNPPQNLRLIMIDPKRVELTLYNKIPHLLTPVITDPKKAILALRWAAKEMERRYDILESESARDIDSYHKNVLAPAIEKAKKDPSTPLPEAMPYIAIFIDELADIMTSYPRELEAAIVRLAQMSRAVGIHLILSTQRPSVNVITGLIKANVPARIALQVASQIDSRTILDMGGAEKLLGAGDMLYLSSDMPQPVRIQSPFISENELKKVVQHLIRAGEDIPPNEINFNTPEQENGGFFASAVEDGAEDVDDDLYEQAREEVIKVGKASTSYLQRKLRIGYSRAARIMDILEERGVIGAQEGSKPRDVLQKSGDNSSSEEYPEPNDEQLQKL